MRPALLLVPLLLLGATKEEARTAVEKGLKHLSTRQRKDGSFSGPKGAFKTAISSLAGLSFLAHGDTPGEGEYAEQVRGILEFLLRSQRANGLIASDKEDRPMYGHGFALLFLTQIYGMESDPDTRARIEKVVEKGIALTVDSQTDAGGWYYTAHAQQDEGSVTITQVQALRSAHDAGFDVKAQAIDRAIGYLKKSQNPDGGLRYQVDKEGESRLPITAAGVASVQSAGKKDHKVAAEVAKKGLINMKKNLKVEQKMGHFYYTHLYAAQAYHIGDPERFEAYIQKMRKVLLAKQEKDGGFASYLGDAYATAIACFILQIPDHHLPLFQR